jgi:hypothetical protein
MVCIVYTSLLSITMFWAIPALFPPVIYLERHFRIIQPLAIRAYYANKMPSDNGVK